MKNPAAFFVGLLILLTALSPAGWSGGTEAAISGADDFVTKLFQQDDASAAFSLTSEAYQAAENKEMMDNTKKVAGSIIGKYVSHSSGRDVTKLLAPNAARNYKIIQYDAVFQNDAAARIIITMVKEKGKWKVYGYNINSPKIKESQLKASLSQTGPAKS